MSRFVIVFLLAVAVPAMGDIDSLDKNIYCTPKWNIEVYYESLCPDSTGFIKNQLHPAYKSFSKHINITLVPFGKAQAIDNGKSFQCQHGERECKLNKMYSCVFHMLRKKPKKQVKFAACEAARVREGNAEEFKCAEKYKVNLKEIKKCTDGKLGTELQLEAETMTLKYKYLNFVPTIVINDHYDQFIENECLEGMKKFLKHLKKYCKKR